MIAIINVNVFDGQTTLNNQAIFVKDDVIQRIIPMADVNQSELPETVVDGKGFLASAGFIDLQINGCGGVLLNTAISSKTLEIMNETNLKSGTTQFLPTFITSDGASLVEVLEMVEATEQPEQQGILGLHIEGPFISVEKKGAHREEFIRELDEKTAHYLADNADKICVLTVAPENTSQKVIDIVREAGITVSLGHTNATYDQVNEKSGLEMATHLYNAMTPLGSREPGVVGYIFDKKPHAGIIVDGIHASYPSVRIAHDIMGEQLFMVTDAVAPAGTDMTEFDMAGLKAYVKDGKCFYADGTIAGAAVTMIQGLNNLINHVGLSREEALRMATLYPAKAIKIENEYGMLKEGYKANITLLSDDNQVKHVFQMGKHVF
ncbi:MULTISPECIES: N-acetylglucosamine-6-phosphate deacetylase [unclassified Photobacterium]|uniref:N-acetylglucosamine-6-phosphate deacetylase n=1 Tax=unclassified Photobacterium TaxID=2628852 RepID=UPI000D171702|nr:MULTISPECIES: N-acetylglucosamine-6-phosphate deacetylase [unclassified Photobacterium]PSV27002.1 N-acetylglucosamine-6-phosphate deacetylase [Photobacterium sp. GB-56]PSV30279.1 N-acetylglucosamine-6-phosphate deacetylase [Photobacterium sp. GB-72]PSV35808.1 N-acetylglucosamine-6-phosphate deacetylase [Photobacterium sp. GB-27]PSV37365.1 N-acetylglucosamine-6-phosphate deacetylase [Photobacterium sp. GB-210]PSV54230.1 N-acetylglucosamine-6-phosphate deacetylase [Photobacterium sp. GB-1]